MSALRQAQESLSKPLCNFKAFFDKLRVTVRKDKKITRKILKELLSGFFMLSSKN